MLQTLLGHEVLDVSNLVSERHTLEHTKEVLLEVWQEVKLTFLEGQTEMSRKS